MNPNATVTEGINPRILELLGLEGTFDLDADTYIQSIKERLLRVTAFNEKLPTEDFNLLRQELKRVQKSKDKEFKNKKINGNKFLGYRKKTISANISSKKLLPPKTTAGALVRTRAIERKSKLVNVLKTEQGPINLLSKIDEKLSSILETLLSANKLDNKRLELERKQGENKKRQERESGLEKGKKVVGTAVQKILKPFQSIFDRIWNFIKFTLLGRAFTMLMNWFADPKNKGKVETLGRFLKDWWPALLFGVAAFTNPFGGLVRTLVGTVVKWTFKITKFAIPKLFSLIKANPLTSLIIGSSVVGTFARTGEREKLKPELEKQRESAKKTQGDKNAPWYQRLGASFAGQELTTGQQQQAIVAPVPGAMYASGGFVSGESGIDKVPAMLSDGEFVMSRGAVAKFGTPFLEALNAAGGGTNKPKVISGTTYAYSGGPIGRSGRVDPVDNIKKFIKYKIGYDVDKPNTWGTAFKSGTSGWFNNESKSPGSNEKGFNFQMGSSSIYNIVKSKIPTGEQLLQTGSNFTKRAKDIVSGINPLPKVGGFISSVAEKQYLGEASAIERERKLGLMKPGADSLTVETKKRLAERDAYVKGLYDPEKDRGIVGNIKKKYQEIENRGLIKDPFAGLKEEKTEKFVEKITGGRVKNLGAKITGLQFAAKGLLGPLGRAFEIDDRGSLGRYLRPAMLEAQKRGHGAVGAKALGQETYDKLVGDKLANLALGQTSFTVDKSGRAKTQDVFDSNNTAENYFKDSRKALKALGNIMQGKKATIGEGKNLEELTGVVGAAKAAYQVAFKGLSGVLRVNQNTGWGNLRPMGNDIDLGGGFKPTDASGKVLSNEQIQKTRKEESLKRFGPSVTLYNKPQANTGQPYQSKFAQPKATSSAKPSKPTTKPQRAWYDPRGWIGKQGGGYVDESFGMNIAGGTADRQLAALQPGEYILPVDVVNKLGAENLNKLVAAFDSNSSPAAKLGYKSKNIPKISPYSSSSSSMTLPPIKSSSSGSMSMPSSSTNLPDFAVVPADSVPFREANAKLLGLVA